MSEKADLYDKYFMRVRRRYDNMILTYRFNTDEMENMKSFSDLHFKVGYTQKSNKDVVLDDKNTAYTVAPMELKAAFCEAYIKKHETFDHIEHNLPADIEDAWLLELVDDNL